MLKIATDVMLNVLVTNSAKDIDFNLINIIKYMIYG